MAIKSARKDGRDAGREYDLREFVEAGKRILDCVDHVPEISSSTVVWNEFKLEERIGRTDGLDVTFKGFVDIVVKVQPKRGKPLLFICDFKTCSWGWPREKREDPAILAQLYLYKHFICKRFALDPKHVRTAFVLLKKRPSRPDQAIEWAPVGSGPQPMREAIDALQADITRMSSGEYSHDRSKCVVRFGKTESVCPYYRTEHCPTPES